MLKTVSIPRIARALCAGIVVSCAWTAPASAQTTGTMRQTQFTVASLATTQKANSVDIKGTVTITSRLAKDPEFGDDKLILVFDMSGLVGTKGQQTYRTAYKEEFVKPHAASQKVEFVFPVSVETEATLAQVITAVGTFALNVDVATGVITSASGTVSPR
jgi:hypothetical protein